MKDWYTIKPKLFKKRTYYLPGCDSGDKGAIDVFGNHRFAGQRGDFGFDRIARTIGMIGRDGIGFVMADMDHRKAGCAKSGQQIDDLVDIAGIVF